MADVDNQPSAAATGASAVTPQSPAKKEKKIKNPRAKPSHPPTSEMVNNAIKGLKERGGSSLQAIKKYVAANYKVDAEKVAPFIKKYLKAAVASGSLVQTKGKGASGSFKLASSTSSGGKQASGDKKKATVATVKPKKSASKRATASSGGEKASSSKAAKRTSSSSSSPKSKKVLAEKKSAGSARARKVAAASSIAEKKAAAVKAVIAPKPKSPSKAKKSNKAGPTKKPKAPKPKTAKAVPAKAKKAASPKRKK